ncbi:MAG: rRNA maturation RNase YbeY [Candidatus Omnitrophica bacterium]|nr:rRNA maturation RNase YbeY [Candidatus Omnitrophota bacterium]
MIRKRVDVNIQSARTPLSKSAIEKFVKKIIMHLPKASDLYWNIAVVSDRDMRILNKNSTGDDCSTDVLSFLYQGDCSFAEIIISIDQAYKNASDYNNTPQTEFLTYLIHGILHILGYNDSTEPKSKRMFKKQDQILARILQ